MRQWQPEKVRKCLIHGFWPVMFGTAAGDIKLFEWQSTTGPITGGGIAKNTISLQKLWNDTKRDWCFWSIPTDGFDLVKFMGIKIYLQSDPNHTYIFHWDRDYKNPNTYDYPWFHPSIMLNKKNKVIVWSKRMKPGTKGKTVWIPRSTNYGDDWFFMRDFASNGLFQYHCTLMEVGNPFMSPNGITIYSTLTGSWQTHAGAPSTTQVKYYWYLDQGLLNGVYHGEAPPAGYDTATSKGVPYYISAWSHANDPQLWIWTPEDWTVGGQRWWFKLSTPSIISLIRSGPFVSKGTSTTFSVFFKYKAKFLFGGPSLTDEINPGQAPKDIPPERYAQASENPFGLQIRDPSTVGLGVQHSWDQRRGMLTARGYQRLTASPSLTDPTQILGEPQETALWHSEEEASEDSDSSWEETETEGT